MEKSNLFIFIALVMTLSVFSILPSLERIWADEVIKNIKVGEEPRVIKYNPFNNNIYVANSDSGTVSVIDSLTNDVIKTIKVGKHPWNLEYNPSNGNTYTSDGRSGTVSVIDISNNTVIKTINVGESPFGLEYNPSNGNIYVGTQSSDKVSVIDSSTNEIIDTIEGIISPQDIEYNPSNDDIYVVSYGRNLVHVIDSSTNEIIKEINTVGSGPHILEYNPSNNNMYVTFDTIGGISIIDSSTNEVIKTINTGDPEGGGPPPLLQALEYNPSNQDMYIANGHSNPLSVVDSSTNEIIHSIDVNDSQYALEYNPSNENIYVTVSNAVIVIDSSTNEIMDIVKTNKNSIALEYNPSNENMYVANWAGDISVISKSSSEELFPVADAGFDQSVNSNNIVQLDGSNSSDPNNFPLSFSWNQTSGPQVTLSDSASSNPTFTAPEVNEQTDLTFQLTVTNDEGTTSESDEVIITVSPVAIPPPEEEPKTIADLIRGIIQNPLDVTNSIDSANEIRNILTDNDRGNDQLVCDLIDSEDENTSNIQEILNC